MKTIILLLILTVSVNSATIDDLKNRLVATGDYVKVGMPQYVPNSAEEKGMGYKKYGIMVHVPRTDSLVASWRIWNVLEQDTLGVKTAWFIDRDPTVPPISRQNLVAEIEAKMDSLSLVGWVRFARKIGNIDFGVVNLHVDSAGIRVNRIKEILRTDGGAWVVTDLK